MNEKFDPEKTIEEGQYQWCVDSQTGERVLIDKINNLIMGVWKRYSPCPLCGK